MKERWSHIIEESSCPGNVDLELYQSGKISDELRFAIESHLADCEQCNDYLDGLSEMSDSVNLNRVENELKNEVHKLLEKNNKERIKPLFVKRLALAASLLIIVGLTFFIASYLNSEKTQLTHQISQETLITTEKQIDNDEARPYNRIKKPERDEPTTPLTQAPISKKANEIKKPLDAHYKVTTIEIADNMDELGTNYEQNKELADNSLLLSNTETASNIITPELAHGVVVDETGEALPGVTVMTNNTKNVVHTDINGSFEIAINPGDSISFAFIGYDKLALPSVTNNEVNITLKSSETALNDVVIVGYGTKSSSAISTTTAYAKSENIWIKTKANAEKNLSNKAKNESLQDMETLLSLTYKTEKKDTIEQAIKYIEKGRYRKAKIIISDLQE